MTFGRRAENSATSCEVRAISGTKIIADRSSSKACLTASMYTSVFPEPVTPCKSTVPEWRFSIAWRAAFCSSVNTFFVRFSARLTGVDWLIERRFLDNPLGKIVCQPVA